MLVAIFVKTGGRPENPAIAKICADIALDEMKAMGLNLEDYNDSSSSETKDEPAKVIARIIAIKDLWASKAGTIWEGELLENGGLDYEDSYLIHDYRNGRTRLPQNGCHLFIKNEQGEFVLQS